MKYTYTGEDERVFPTLGITVTQGDSFDSDEKLDLPYLTTGKTTAPAVETPTPTDTTVGA